MRIFLRFIFLWIIILFINLPFICAQNPEADTTLINTLIKKANSESISDSALTNYQKAIKLCKQKLQSSSISKNLRVVITRKSIEAEIGLGLIHYQRVEYEVAMQHFEMAYQMAEELNEHYYLGECLFNFAEVYLEQSKYTLAMTRYFEALQEYSATDSLLGVYWCYIGMGIVQKQCGNYNDAIICYEKALGISEKEGLKPEAAYCHNNLGIVYRREGNYGKSMEQFEKALTCFSVMKDDLLISDCFTNIGNLYLDQGDPFRALDYYNRAISSDKVKADNYRMVSRYKNLADAYTTLKDYQNASLFMEKAIILAGKSDDKVMLASCYSQLGELYLSSGSREIGISYLKKSVDLFHSVGSKVEEAECLIELANAELGAGKITDAFDHAVKGEELAKNSGVAKTIYAANSCMALLWEKKGNPEKSLAYLKQAIQLKDSIFNLEKNRTVEEIEAGFTRSKLENENQILSQKGKLQQQSLRIRNVAVSLLSICLILSFTIIWLVYKRHIESKSKAIHEKAISRQEIDSLTENLQLKDRELASKTLYITQKNNLLQKLINELDELKEEPGKTRFKIDRLQHELKTELSPNAWKEFEVQFNEVHPNFQTILLEKFPELSPTERRLCAFLRLDMNTREICSLTGQSFKSIEVARTRIRKKMGLSHEDNLSNFIAFI
jgi:tetratricopeptide (TPR) repeat protein